MTVRLVLIGDHSRAEFRPIVDWCAARGTPHEQTFAPTVDAALSFPTMSVTDLIVVLESQPDEYTPAEVAALYAASPLARVVCCAGLWSEAAGRTRKHWPPALRIPAVSAVERLDREWRLLTDSNPADWLPSTGDRQETFAANHPTLDQSLNPGWLGTAALSRPQIMNPVPEAAPTAGSPEQLSPATRSPILHSEDAILAGFTVRIISADADYRAMLTDLCRSCDGWLGTAALSRPRIMDSPATLSAQSLPTGGSPERLSPATPAATPATGDPPVEVILYDIDPWHSSRLPQLQSLLETSPVIALTGWLTPELATELHTAGVVAVIPKLGDQRRLLSAVYECGSKRKLDNSTR